MINKHHLVLWLRKLNIGNFVLEASSLEVLFMFSLPRVCLEFVLSFLEFAWSSLRVCKDFA